MDTRAALQLLVRQGQHEHPYAPSPPRLQGFRDRLDFRLYPDCDETGCIDLWDHMCGQIPGTCRADLDDGSATGTPDGGVDINDLLYFLAQYEAGSLNADLDDGSGEGNPDYGVDIKDLLFFLLHYEGGC